MQTSIRRAYLLKKENNKSIENIYSKSENNQEEKRKNEKNKDERDKMKYVSKIEKRKNEDNKDDRDKIKYISIIGKRKNENNKDDRDKIKYVPKIEENKQMNNHDNNLKIIEKLKKELDDLNKENKIIIKEMNDLKREERNHQANYNKIMNEINKETKELNKLKDFNANKNAEYLQLKNQHREMMIRDFRELHTETINEINRHSLHRFFERLIYLSRLRSGNNVEPQMTIQQIQDLPISYYPNRNNISNEKCVICSFPFCYNDVIIRLRRCNHIFHKACLTNTLTFSRSAVCPTCHASIL